MLRMKLSRVLAAIASGALIAVAGAAPPVAASTVGHGKPQSQTVRGSWVSPTCAFTDYDPVTGAFECTASSQWTGSWTGITTAQAEGTYDFVTGSGSGTIKETFVGRSSDGTTGTLRFTETFVADGPSLTLHVDARIVEGTGDWVGATGYATFDGTLSSGTGFGGYAGSWTRPR
jgi:hypothetical protein